MALLTSCALQPPSSGSTTPVAPATPIASSPSTTRTAGPTPSSASLSPDAPTAGPSETLTLGPKGVGTLTLGATRDAAHATRLVHGLSGSKGLCGADGDGWIGSKAPAEDDETGRLFFSANTGKLVAIYAYRGLATPEGIKLGSTLGQVKTAYSHWEYYAEEGRGYATVPGNSKANYRIAIVDDKVFELSLDSVDQDCYE